MAAAIAADAIVAQLRAIDSGAWPKVEIEKGARGALAAQLDLFEEIKRMRKECFTGTKGEHRASEQVQAFDRGLARIASRLAQNVTFGPHGFEEKGAKR